MSSRPSYKIVDTQDRDAHINSRNDVLNKSFVTDLWMKVITRAIDDLALYEIMRRKGKELREEDLENEESALGFLFDDNYYIPMDDYLVDVKCSKCEGVWTELLSTVVGQNSKCQLCHTIISKKYIEYEITGQQRIKEISLRELISLWGIEDINGFREGTKRRVLEIVEKKCNKKQKKKK